ncbi:glycosyltransferase [Pedobacter sp. MR2016-19]|uniref:glycosyltransferase family 2 protein n=1 Tax=Pedobacter sp. MR2016-19 TaxID=2780089 RepID=UPI0018734571|nr:glycosyltransferase [Pedobacter sp. MR2016-19]MBE5320610.1 glycosyltransferase [Pedobacter sp. MR2016-19]
MDKMLGEPIVTVLMPVYNAEKYLDEALCSILNQTFTAFELLIINDGSSDHTENIIKKHADERITYLKNSENQGIVKSLNIGINLSKGKYIARMDADDIAKPTRLQQQVDFMLANPEYKLCGSQAIAIDENSEAQFQINIPCEYNEIRVQMLFKNTFIHPAVMLDTQIAKSILYSIHYQYAEDYYLFSQITLNYKVANLNDHLLYYRVHSENITSKKKAEMRQSEKKVIKYNLNQLFGEAVSDETISTHLHLFTQNFQNLTYKDVESHLLKIKISNKVKQLYNNDVLTIELQRQLYVFLSNSSEKLGFIKLISSTLFSPKGAGFKQFRKLFKKSFFGLFTGIGRGSN